MPSFLTDASILMCPHGGTVTIVSSNKRVQAAGGFVARASDTFIIAGCPFNIIVPHPCVQVQWIVTAERSTVVDDAPLTESSVGLCLAADMAPQGPVVIVSTQPQAAGL